MPVRPRASALIVITVALIAGSVVPPAVSEVDAERIKALWKDYQVANKRLQYDLARLLTHEWPELQGVAGLQRDQQFALIELSNMKFQYVLAVDPDRIVVDDGLSTLADFEWTDEDGEALRAQNRDFVKLERWAEMNAQRLSEHTKLSASGQRVITLHRDKRYRSMITRYKARINDLESALDSIARAHERSERMRLQKAQMAE